MAVHAYHPETGHDLVVEDTQMDHMRLSGWVTMAEHREREAAAAAAQAKDDAKAAKAAAKADN